MILLIFNSLFCQYHKFKQSKKHRFTNSKKLINANDLVHLFCQTELVEVLKRMAWAFSAIHFPAFRCNLFFLKRKKKRISTSIGAN